MSDLASPRKEPPPELQIAASPRPVTRLTRMALVVTTALATAFIFTALWYALGMRPLHLVSGPEFYNTNRPTDRRARPYDRQLRRSHASETGAATGSAARTGDLGRPMLQQSGAPPAADPDTERRRREREQAAASVVLFTVSAKPTAPGWIRPGPCRRKRRIPAAGGTRIADISR